MSEGYNLFNKVVGVLEKANIYQRVTGSAPFPGSAGEVNICTITFDSPGIYLVLTRVEAILIALYNNLTKFNNVVILGGNVSRANVWGGGGLNGWFLVNASEGGTATLTSYYSDAYDPGGDYDKNFTGEIVAIKLLGGGVLLNRSPRKAVVA